MPMVDKVLYLDAWKAGEHLPEAPPNRRLTATSRDPHHSETHPSSQSQLSSTIRPKSKAESSQSICLPRSLIGPTPNIKRHISSPEPDKTPNSNNESGIYTPFSPSFFPILNSSNTIIHGRPTHQPSLPTCTFQQSSPQPWPSPSVLPHSRSRKLLTLRMDPESPSAAAPRRR